MGVPYYGNYVSLLNWLVLKCFRFRCVLQMLLWSRVSKKLTAEEATCVQLSALDLVYLQINASVWVCVGVANGQVKRPKGDYIIVRINN